ncbi:hypothetical protein DVH24_014823 [Malus domestica]|uniref:SAWADEE domain-containing protein n=1 Tax=Malus domestica TaxID=3750 RepID=A0A498K5D9_MALDO|nr:hypothetical protein DVH24_014823 [Malus domestica]
MAVEFRSGLDAPWYDGKDGCDRLRVKFVGYGDDHDEVYEVSELSSFNDIDEFRRRFRQVSVQVQDTECVSAATNTAPFSQHYHHQCLKEMSREGSDEVQFSRVPGGVQEPPVHFRLRAHLASTPPTRRIARLSTPPSSSSLHI